MVELSHAEQDRVLRPTNQRNRRIILATPIAETSITIEGIGCVVDSGLCPQAAFQSGIRPHQAGNGSNLAGLR